MINDLKFGTAGIRVKNLDLSTVKKVISGYAQWLKPTDIIYIGYDTRKDSKFFAQEAAYCLAGYGIKSFIFKNPVPVAVLSYTVANYGNGGIMFTASHNPKEYNGIKIYNEFGKQILQNEANAIEKCINSILVYKRKHIKLNFVPNKIINEYFSKMYENSNFYDIDNLSVVYTALDGVGLYYINKLLNHENIEYNIVQEEANKILNINIPNPEEKVNYKKALIYAQEINADLILATDCDCDRVGCMIKHNNKYRLLTGNELGIILTKFFKDNNITGKIITSEVSTLMIDKLYSNVIRVPVGFKNITDKIDEQFLFAFEDTCGFLAGNYTYDKDAVIGIRLILEAVSYYKKLGLDLIDVLQQIYQQYGKSSSKTYTFKYKGKKIYKKFDLGKRKIIIRSSGTEPKLKIYILR